MNYLVDFINTATRAEIDAYAAANGMTVLKTYSNYENVYLMECTAEPAVGGIVEKVIHDDPNGITLMDITYTLDNTAPSTTVPTADAKQWWKIASFNTVDFNAADTTFERHGKKSTIYLVDSGVDIGHPDFVGANVSNLFTFNENFADTRGHGTALASVMVGKDCGVTNATVKSVKIFDANQPTLLSDLLAGFNAVLTDYVLNGQGSAIANLSWNTARNTYLEDKINVLIDAGIYVVASAGNEGQAITDVTPAAMDRVITVGAYNQDLTPCNFSNYTGIITTTPGAVNTGALDVWAPGEQIWSAGLGDTFGYVAGTSSAAAIMSATLAYNMDRYVNDAGVKMNLTAYEQDGMFALTVIGRKDILTLPNQYSQSINRIATIQRTYELNVGLRPNFEFRVITPYDYKIYFMLYDTFKYKSLTLTDNLPPGFTIENGVLIGVYPNPSSGIESTSQFITTATLTDNNNNSINCNFIITAYSSAQYLTNNNVQISIKDPTLRIVLAEGGTDGICAWDGSGCSPSSPPCNGYCVGDKNGCTCMIY